MNRRTATLLIASSACLWNRALQSAAAATQPVKIRMSVDEDPIVPRLAESLGYLKREGVELVKVKVEDFAAEDYLLQQPLIQGQIDASYHWFNHAVFGARHKLPVTAVMLFNDAPGMTVLVANRVKHKIHSAADFKGRRVAEGAGYGTKSLLTNYLARKAGLPPHSFIPVLTEPDGRLQAVINGLEKGTVDVMTFQEPITSALLGTGMVTPLYDLNSAQSTRRVLGATWPAQSLLVAPAFIAANPHSVQRLVNAFVSAMRFISTHSVEEIIAALPSDYFSGKDRQIELAAIRAALPTFAQSDYSFPAAAVHLVVDAIQSFDFDGSAEGRWRATAEWTQIDESALYTNRFVRSAVQHTG